MANSKKLAIIPNWCKGCGICVAFCPKGALELINEKVALKEGADCVKCGLCEQRCPDYAIFVEQGAEN